MLALEQHLPITVSEGLCMAMLIIRNAQALAVTGFEGCTLYGDQRKLQALMGKPVRWPHSPADE